MGDDTQVSFYDVFAGCGHLLDEIYESAVAIGQNEEVADNIIAVVYAKYADRYERLKPVACFPTRIHSLDVHVLDEALSELEKLSLDKCS